MSYDWTTAARNSRAAREQAYFGTATGIVLGTDDTEANETVTNPAATTHQGAIAPVNGVGRLTHRIVEAVGGRTYEEFGLMESDGTTLSVRRPLDAPMTLTNIGDIGYVGIDLTAPAASA